MDTVIWLRVRVLMFVALLRPIAMIAYYEEFEAYHLIDLLFIYMLWQSELTVIQNCTG